jgi:hypothetical protein
MAHRKGLSAGEGAGVVERKRGVWVERVFGAELGSVRRNEKG